MDQESNIRLKKKISEEGEEASGSENETKPNKTKAHTTKSPMKSLLDEADYKLNMSKLDSLIEKLEWKHPIDNDEMRDSLVSINKLLAAAKKENMRLKKELHGLKFTLVDEFDEATEKKKTSEEKKRLLMESNGGGSGSDGGVAFMPIMQPVLNGRDGEDVESFFFTTECNLERAGISDDREKVRVVRGYLRQSAIKEYKRLVLMKTRMSSGSIQATTQTLKQTPTTRKKTPTTTRKTTQRTPNIAATTEEEEYEKKKQEELHESTSSSSTSSSSSSSNEDEDEYEQKELEEEPDITWNDFKAAFVAKSRRFQAFNPVEKLLKTRQNGASVSSYTRTMEDLLDSTLISDESLRVQFFVNGLDEAIQSQVLYRSPATLNEAARIAQIAAQCLVKEKDEMLLFGGGPPPMTIKTMREQQQQQVGRRSNLSSSRMMMKGGFGGGFGSGGGDELVIFCFNCGKRGHLARQCRNKSSDSSIGGDIRGNSGNNRGLTNRRQQQQQPMKMINPSKGRTTISGCGDEMRKNEQQQSAKSPLPPKTKAIEKKKQTKQ